MTAHNAVRGRQGTRCMDVLGCTAAADCHVLAGIPPALPYLRLPAPVVFGSLRCMSHIIYTLMRAPQQMHGNP